MFIQIKNMKICNFRILPALIAAAVAAWGCADAEKRAAGFEEEFDLSVGGKEFSAQVAITDSEKSRGLMFRDFLKENGGMVFVYGSQQRASFWMKNTRIPLDIAFFTADGTLTEVKKLYPNNLDPVASSRGDIAYCIEMNSGWFSKNGVYPPAKLDMRKLEAAIGARK